MQKHLASQLNDFEKKRNEFLVLLIQGDIHGAGQVYLSLFENIQTMEEIPEIIEKTIRQSQRIYNKFKEQIVESRQVDLIRANRNIRKILADTYKKYKDTPLYVGYNEWCEKSGLSEKQYRILAETVTLFQLSKGCGNFCRRCNEWALPGPVKHFTYDAVTRFTEDFFEAGNNAFVYYGSSDPLEWRHGDKTITDILKFLSRKKYNPLYGLLTKIPGKTEKVFMELLDMDADMAVSVTEKNRTAVLKIKNTTAKKINIQHDVDELEIPAGLDENFDDIKPSITDNYGVEITPEGAFIIIPAFTSGLNPTGQRRIPVTAGSNVFIKRKTGRDALAVEYFKPIECIGLNGRAFKADWLFDVQIENIMQDSGVDGPCPPGMMSIEEFFSTFEYNAVMSRKKLFKSVVKKLRTEIILQNRFNESRSSRYNRFKKRVLDYYEYTAIDSVKNMQKNAFSFFLSCVADYLKDKPAELEIIRWLRREDVKKYRDTYTDIFQANNLSVNSLINMDGLSAFSKFEILLFLLLENPFNPRINAFIIENPSMYDPEIDRFKKNPRTLTMHNNLSSKPFRLGQYRRISHFQGEKGIKHTVSS